MDTGAVREGKKNVIAGLGCMIIFFLVAMLMGFLSEYEGNDLPPSIELILGLFVEEGYFPSLTKLEWHLKYSHVHGEGLGVFCTLYGLVIGMATRPFVRRYTPWLVIFGTFLVPFGFLGSMVYPNFIYLLTAGTIILTFSFILFLYDILLPSKKSSV